MSRPVRLRKEEREAIERWAALSVSDREEVLDAIERRCHEGPAMVAIDLLQKLAMKHPTVAEVASEGNLGANIIAGSASSVRPRR